MILVTGATGHVGSELIGQLIEQGRAVRALVRDQNAAVPGSVELVVGDLTRRRRSQSNRELGGRARGCAPCVPVERLRQYARHAGRDAARGCTVAATLPEPTGAALLDTARAAFTEAVVLTAMLSAILAIAAAIVTVTMLRVPGSQTPSVAMDRS